MAFACELYNYTGIWKGCVLMEESHAWNSPKRKPPTWLLKCYIPIRIPIYVRKSQGNPERGGIRSSG